MNLNFLFFAAILLHSLGLSAQPVESDTTTHFKEKIKKGWNFGVLPAVAFDSDIGFQYGIVANAYNYGDGTYYPSYKHALYVEWSRTTKGSGKNQIMFDSEHLIPNIRVSAEASYLTEQALYFYGFNGYEAYYNRGYETKNDPSYISKMYYRIDRKLTRFNLSVQGNIIGRTLRWLAGYTFFDNKIGRVDINRLNQGKSESDKLRDTSLLYDQFLKWGIIPTDQQDGGITNILKLGAVYDTRDNEPNPMKGIWTEAMLLMVPSFLDNRFSFMKLVVTHRQYFTLKRKVLNLAYRLSYQGKIAGEMPFYMLPFIFNSTIIRDGLGGAKTLRGILRNRVVGEDMLYGNIELRWKFLRMVKFNQNFYSAVAVFTDFGRVVGKYKFIETEQIRNDYLKYGDPESWHQSYGIGLYGAMNQNFIASVNYGMAVDPRDGNNGMYIGLDFLF
jgi:outer membrane protein assembly factor BamA